MYKEMITICCHTERKDFVIFRTSIMPFIYKISVIDLEDDTSVSLPKEYIDIKPALEEVTRLLT